MTTLILVTFALAVGIYLGFLLGFSRAMQKAAVKIQRTPRSGVAKIVVGLGCAVLLGALISLVHTWRFTRVAQRAVGEVVAMRGTTDTENGGISYAPTFRFQDAGGSQHTVSSTLYSSPPEFQLGDRVQVLYRSDDPGVARIDSYWQVWGLASVLGILGAVTSVGGLAVLNWPCVLVRFRGQRAV